MNKKRQLLPDEFDNKMKALGKLIRVNRQRKNMTIQQLAVQADVCESYIWQIEMGRKNISYSTLWRISEILEVPSGQRCV